MNLNMNNIKFYYLGQVAEVEPETGDIIEFENGSVCIFIDRALNGIRLQSLHRKYLDRGWIYRFLEKIRLLKPVFIYEPIRITNKAYVIGRTAKEGK